MKYLYLFLSNLFLINTGKLCKIKLLYLLLYIVQRLILIHAWNVSKMSCVSLMLNNFLCQFMHMKTL